jgi:hypothetical protein
MQERVSSFIAGQSASGFNELALEVFAYQYARHDLYRRFCAARGASPATVRDWSEIPAIPVDAFKHGLIADSGQRFHFLSSGTTGGQASRSRHPLASLETYRQASMAHFETMVLPDHPGPMATLILGPTSATHPNSSLGAMFSWCAECFGSDQRLMAFDASGNADIDAAIDWLGVRARQSAPVLILALTVAASELFAELRRRDLALRLPADSRLVDTGGRKRAGAVHILSPRAVLKAAWRFLHVPAYLCINEYGMTEMLSQFYDDAWRSRTAGRLAPRAKAGPSWVRSRIVDPVTLLPARAGDPGILCHADLANWETVSFLQTADLARQVGSGFELLGRLPGAPQRGCSELSAEVAPGLEAGKATERP